MASSKLYKPNYSHGATTSNYSESHQEYNQAQSSSMAKSKPNDSYSHGLANKSTNYYAQAQCAQPSPAVKVVQTTHVVKTMEKQESIKGSKRVALAGAVVGAAIGFADSLKCANSAQSAQSELVMHHEEHTIGKMDQGWAQKPNCELGSSNVGQYGLEMHKQEHMMGKVDQGWAGKPTQTTTMGLGNQFGQSLYKEQEEKAYNFSEGGVEKAWATKPAKYLGSSQSNNSLHTMYNEHEHEHENDQDGFGPIHNTTTGLGVHKENHMMTKTDQGWANSSMSRPHSNHSNVGMYNDDDHVMDKVGLEAHPTSNLFGPTKPNNSGLNMYKDEHVMEKSEHAFVAPLQGNQFGGKNSGYSSDNQLGYSGKTMYKEQAQTAFGPSRVNYNDSNQTEFGPSQVNHAGLGQNGYNSAHNGFGPAQVNQSAHGVSHNGFGTAQGNYSAHGAMGSAQNGYGSSHGGMGSTQNGHGSAQTNYSAHGGMGSTQNGYGSSYGGMGSTQSGHGSAQTNYSAHGGMGSAPNGYGPSHGGMSSTQNGYGSGQANHSNYGVAHNAFGSAQNGYGVTHGNHSAHSLAQNGYGSSQANNSAYGKAQANYSAQSGMGSTHNGYGSAQVNHSALGTAHTGYGSAQSNYATNGKAQTGFGLAQSNYSGHGSHNYMDQHEDHEGVHDIMDEILTKYPAHNVSGGNGGNWAARPGSSVGLNQSASYAKQQAYVGPGQQGMVSQSSSSKFSHSSSANKFEMKGQMNNGGGLCHNRGVDDCDF